MTPEAEDFLTCDYAALRDLSKSFLTLISAVLTGKVWRIEKVLYLKGMRLKLPRLSTNPPAMRRRTFG